MAALIAQATGLAPDIVEGARGEFSVRVNDRVVARKDTRGFPADDEVVAGVNEALAT